MSSSSRGRLDEQQERGNYDSANFMEQKIGAQEFVRVPRFDSVLLRYGVSIVPVKEYAWPLQVKCKSWLLHQIAHWGSRAKMINKLGHITGYDNIV